MGFCRRHAARRASASGTFFRAVGLGVKSDVGSQGGMELREALDQLLELRPLLWVQGPATGHHSKPAE